MSTCVPELHNLIPLAGGTLAISLSYLNLERFRYATTIQESAKSAFSQFDTEEIKARVGRTKEYRVLMYLASLEKNIRNKEKAPDGVPWKRLLLFTKRIDTYFGGLFAIASGLALCLGTAHTIKLFLLETCFLFTIDVIEYTYFGLFAGMLSPVVFVLVGNSIIRLARSFVPGLEENVKVLVEDSEKAEQGQLAARSATLIFGENRGGPRWMGPRGGGGDSTPGNW